MSLSLLCLWLSAISFGLGAFQISRVNINWLCLGAMFYVLSQLL